MVSKTAAVEKLYEKVNQEQKPEKVSYWGRCEQHNCKLLASVSAARKTCSYHFNMHGYEAEKMTEAINENLNLIKKLNEMTYWTAWDWKQRRAQMMGWPVLSLEENELPSIYLERFRNMIKNEINNVCADLIQRGL
jgi:hypothetical protein